MSLGSGRGVRAAASLLIFSGLLTPSGAAPTVPDPGDLELVGVFAAPALLTGAALVDDHLFVTGTNSVSIFDVSSPVAPILVGSAPSPHPIHGELISTNGEIMLLNDGFGGETLDVWNVEDRSNPVVIGTVGGVPDEHWGCIRTCTWAYGSAGSIVDLRDPARPTKTEADWKMRAGLPAGVSIHRVDEYRPGYLVTGSAESSPTIIDARDPRRPRAVGRASLPTYGGRRQIIYSSWPLGGRSRYLLAAVEFQESGDCSDPAAGMLLSFDTKGYPQRTSFPLAGRLRTTSGCGGNGFYFDPHPRFERERLTILPYFEGVAVVRIDSGGRLTELGTFEPPLGLIWLAFWVTEDIVYAVNQTGEIYILRHN